MNPADLAPVVAENIRISQALSAALVSLEGMTPPQFAAKHPDADLSALMQDADFMQQVELFSSKTPVQERALEAQLRRGLSDSVTGLVAKIQAPDISGAALGAASDALTKISNLMEKREAAKREGGRTGLYRQLYRMGQEVTITSLGEDTKFQLVERLTYENTISAIRLMCCVTDDEVKQVVKAVQPNNSPLTHELITLRWF